MQDPFGPLSIDEEMPEQGMTPRGTHISYYAEMFMKLVPFELNPMWFSSSMLSPALNHICASLKTEVKSLKKKSIIVEVKKWKERILRAKPIMKLVRRYVFSTF